MDPDYIIVAWGLGWAVFGRVTHDPINPNGIPNGSYRLTCAVPIRGAGGFRLAGEIVKALSADSRRGGPIIVAPEFSAILEPPNAA